MIDVTQPILHPEHNSESNQSPHHKHKILIIDDNLVVRKLIASQLSSDGLDVYEAENGETGLAQVAQLRPSLVLLDYFMPDMDGFEVFNAIRCQAQFTNLPIIVMSASQNDVVQKFGSLLKPQDFLTKQSSYDEFRKRIYAALPKGDLTSASDIVPQTAATSINMTVQDISEFMTHVCQMEDHLNEMRTNHAISVRETQALAPSPDTAIDVPSPSSLSCTSPQSLASDSATVPYSYATQDLLNALPRLWTRGLLYLLITFTAISLPLAVLSKADETGTARGRLEPEGNTYKVGAAISGKVAKVLVKEGQQISKNQPLLELESDQISVQLQQVQAKLSGQIGQMGQLQLIKNQINLQMLELQKQSQTQDLEKQAQVAQAQQTLAGKQGTFGTQSAEKQALLDQAREALALRRSNLTFVQKQLDLDKQVLDRYLQAQSQGALPEITVIQKQKEVEESQRQLAQATSDIQQAQSQLAEQENRSKSTGVQLQSELSEARLRLKEQQRNHQGLTHSGNLALQKGEQQLQELQSQLSVLQTDIAQSEKQIDALKLQLAQRVVRSPTSGTIYKLPIQRRGAVVEPSTLIAEIAQQGVPLILRAQMTTQESGFLRKEMPVRLKFDAYPFQDYGVVKGQLNRISPTSQVTKTDRGDVSTFEVEVKLQQSCIHSAKECIALNPGQTATAEVVIRQRRVIDFFLDPFKKLGGNGLKL